MFNEIFNQSAFKSNNNLLKRNIASIMIYLNIVTKLCNEVKLKECNSILRL